jgi:hypothetical protein
MRKIIEFILLILLALYAWKFTNDMQTELYGLVIGGVLILLLDFAAYINENKNFFSIYWKCWTFKRNEPIRLSFSYLWKIEHKGLYLLVRSNRIENTYQPVGGVYKYFHPETQSLFHSIGLIPDTGFVNDTISEYDLRVKLKRRTKIRALLNWFFSKENREIDPWREFTEELVVPSIFPDANFRHISYVLGGQCMTNLHWDKHFKIDTIKYFDIFIPRFKNVQKDSLHQLQSNIDQRYIWVTDDEIEQGKTKSGQLISEHTKHIFESKL